MAQDPGAVRYRFGIGEWFGRLFSGLSVPERRQFLEYRKRKLKDRPPPACPFQSTASSEVPCSKRDGVCTLRLYKYDPVTGQVGAQGPTPESSRLRTMCPNRFREGGMLTEWAGEVILGNPTPIELGEIPFLRRPPIPTGDQEEPPEDYSGAQGDEADSPGSEKPVGRIDDVLVAAGSEPLDWCALEIQSVYFQGPGMASEFEALGDHEGTSLLFPKHRRGPDYRSSGVKRLMPQLQIKVPTLRRWGKKMALVIDEAFLDALDGLEDHAVDHISNCDIVWLVARYEDQVGSARLVRGPVVFTTLEAAVEALTSAEPLTLPAFEARLQAKMEQQRIARARLETRIKSLGKTISTLEARQQRLASRIAKAAERGESDEEILKLKTRAAVHEAKRGRLAAQKANLESRAAERG